MAGIEGEGLRSDLGGAAWGGRHQLVLQLLDGPHHQCGLGDLRHSGESAEEES